MTNGLGYTKRFSETNDNLVAILLTYGTACVVLDGDAEVGRSSDERFVYEALNGHQGLKVEKLLT